MERRCFRSWFATRYHPRLDQKQVLRAKPYPPLATLQAVSLLRGAGHRVSFFDAMLADGVEEYDGLLRADRRNSLLLRGQL